MRVEDAVLVVLGLLGNASATRIHKVLFLALIEGGVEIEADFKPHYFGPWSPDIQNAIANMVSEGFIEELRSGLAESGYTTKTYRLTPKGEGRLRDVHQHINPKDLHRLRRITRNYGRTPLSYLTVYMCMKYPEYSKLCSMRFYGVP